MFRLWETTSWIMVRQACCTHIRDLWVICTVWAGVLSLQWLTPTQLVSRVHCLFLWLHCVCVCAGVPRVCSCPLQPGQCLTTAGQAPWSSHALQRGHQVSASLTVTKVSPSKHAWSARKRLGYSQLWPLQPACSQNEARSYVPDSVAFFYKAAHLLC